MGDTDSFYSESNESLIDEIFGTLSRNRSLRRDEVKGKRSYRVIQGQTGHQWPKKAIWSHSPGLNKVKIYEQSVLAFGDQCKRTNCAMYP